MTKKFTICGLLKNLNIRADGSMTLLNPAWNTGISGGVDRHSIAFAREFEKFHPLTEWLKNVLAAGGVEMRDLRFNRVGESEGLWIWIKTATLVWGITQSVRNDANFKRMAPGIKYDLNIWGHAERIARGLILSRCEHKGRGRPVGSASTDGNVEPTKAEKAEIQAARRAAGGNGGVGDLLRAVRKSCRG